MKDSVLHELELIFISYPELEICRTDIINAFHLMNDCRLNKGLIMTCGNGGSASDSDHIVGELMKEFKLKRPLNDTDRKAIAKEYPIEKNYLINNLQQAIPALSLVSQTAISSAFMNDVSPDMVFAQQVFGYGKPEDLLIGLSTSGCSQNVVNACRIAKAKGIKTLGLTGQNGGEMKPLCDVIICVPAQQTYRIQEYHLPIYHALCAMLEMEAFN